MKKVLLDTNVILDFALAREPFSDQAEKILDFAFQKKINASITASTTASTVTDIYFITKKVKDSIFALDFIKSLLEMVDIVNVDKRIIRAAIESGVTGFEDAVQDQAARQHAINAIITRNEKDFKQAVTSVLNPEEFLKFINEDNRF